VQAFNERTYQFGIDSAGDVEFSSGAFEFLAAVAAAQLFAAALTGCYP
jgi:hypothetical protein